MWPDNPIGRLDREAKRRADAVQIFPGQTSVARLVGAIPPRQHREWQHGGRRCLPETSTRRLALASRPARLPGRPSRPTRKRPTRPGQPRPARRPLLRRQPARRL
ncbi:MAG: transposase, partial [Propionibacteriaceae bacterium]|nr:transposase [Propionibacteriaceae bacterium]